MVLSPILIKAVDRVDEDFKLIQVKWDHVKGQEQKAVRRLATGEGFAGYDYMNAEVRHTSAVHISSFSR